jgi:hypothetical protein
MLKLYSLLILLIVVLFVQYHVLREGFKDDVQVLRTQDDKIAVNTVISPAAIDTDMMDLSYSPIMDTSSEASLSNSKLKKSQFLRDIQDMIRNEVYNQRSMTNSGLTQGVTSAVAPAGGSPVNTGASTGQNAVTSKTNCSANMPLYSDSTSCNQGKEFESNCPKDMSKYIKKDSIPCWGCNIP